MLHVAVGDPPWNTGMAWVDAVNAFPERDPAEVDAIVRDALLDLLDRGYIFFFRFTDFDDEFRPRSAAEGLAREEVAAVLTAGRLTPGVEGGATVSAVSLSDGSETPGGARQRAAEVRLAEVLAFRATEAGEREHGHLAKDDYRIFGRGPD